ncbi:hypothetical protein VIGAN_01092200 [Vigna angularis var. angularis]|uniref:Uncharacterized protein n=1 Tax=Vigna angularis var. angularis TaxID=157739 RepID=A0A0S3QYQ8_PHAAN|nr:hypothetical protein VIGAN_01092200 [Vigna angularis var. angularis]
MVAYLSKQRGRRAQKETKHREKHFITASTSAPPNNVPTTVFVPSSSGGQKRSRKANGDAIVDAMLEIVIASKMRVNAILKNDDKFSISKCIKVLDELQGVDEQFYFLVLDLFENNSSAREIFISLKGDKRLPCFHL